MSLVHARTDSGLVVVEHGADEAAVARALKDRDRDLRLVRQLDLERQVQVWRVYAYRGPDQPAVFVLAWQTESGEPLPLSHRLVDAVVRQDRNSRTAAPDEDALNRKLHAQREKDWERDTEALADDWAFKHGRPILHRGVGLRMARDRRRARGENC